MKKNIGSAGTVVQKIQSAFSFRNNDEKIEFLLHASEILASSLQYEETLSSVANLVVPRLAEWCTIHVHDQNDSIQQLVLAHADPAMIKYAEELNKKYPPDYSAPTGIGAIFKSGKPEFIAEITDEMLTAGIKDPEQLRIMRDLHLGSYMAVPLSARGKTIGVISFFSISGKHYTESDLLFAESLANRAATAVDNARLYQEAQRAYRQVHELNEALEGKVQERTEQLRLSQERDKSNLHRLKTMLANLPMAALMMDEQRNILELNQEYCAIFHIGVSANEAMQLSHQDLNDRFSRCLLKPEEHMKEVLETIAARKLRLGHDIYLKDGRIVQRDFLPIYDQDKFLGQLFLYRDVTRERRIDATKSEFMSLASHQLRTPLTSMRWATSMLGRTIGDKLNEFEQRLLEECKEGVARMSETIDTMLHISHIEAGETQCTIVEVHVSGLLHELVKQSMPEYSDKHLSVSIDCPDDMSMHTDVSLLKELLGNLIDNAMKYTPEHGTIRLEVKMEGNRIVFLIQDSGYGIPQHQQANIFKKFFRGENVVDKVTKGTGLGLYLVSLLANLLGGAIEFVSVEGRGTTFTLTFPVHGAA